MKRTVSIILALICVLSLASCGANTLDKTSGEIAESLPEKIDLSELDVLTDEDEGSTDLLFFVYDLDESLGGAIESFMITNVHRNTDPRAIAVLFFKDSENVKDNIASAKACLGEFLETRRNATATYDPESAAIVNAATFKEYDNALVMVSYDTNGNTEVFNAIEGK